MPEQPLPDHPDFHFFATPDDEELALEYPYPAPPERVTRVTDAAECERLRAKLEAAEMQLERYRQWYGARERIEADMADMTGKTDALSQLEAARLAWAAAYKALITDNPWRVEDVRAALRAIGAALGVE